MTSGRLDKAVAWALLVTAVATVVYWVDFYVGDTVQVRDEAWYIIFQKSFPVADAWMACCAAFGAVGLLRRRTFGPPCGLLAASALVFLALMDITFNVQNGLYALAATSSAMQFEIVINLWTLGLGSVGIVVLWPRMNLRGPGA